MPLTVTAQNYVNSSNSLINGLGGTRGFGEFTMGPNDDNSITIDLTQVFGADGLKINGESFTSAQLSNNGYFQLNSNSGNNLALYNYTYDVDTRMGPLSPTPGGNSTGSNLTWYDLDAANKVLTLTWDDVGQYSYNGSNPQAFQLQIIEGSSGEAIAVFRYESVSFSYPSVAAYGSANNYQWVELFSGVPRDQLDTTMGTNGQNGVFAVNLLTLSAPVNSAPVANADTGVTSEDGSVTIAVLANDTDPNAGDSKTLVSVDTSGTTGSVSINSDQTVTYNPGAAFQSLAQGQNASTSFQYTMRDSAGLTSTSTVAVTIQGANDAPVVSGAVTGAASEDGAASSLNALVNASDVDAGTTLSVTGVPTSLPAGVTYDAAAKTFTLNGADTAYQSLAVGQSTTVSVAYGVTDGTATTPASMSWTVTGTNDAPVVSGVVTGAVAEDAAASTLSARANATDVDAGAVLNVVEVPTTLPAGVTYDADTQSFTLNPSAAAYQSLGLGQTSTVSVAYGVSDGAATTSASLSWTVTGANDGPVAVADVGSVSEDATITLNVLSNDTDIDAGDAKAISSVGPTALGGSVSIVDNKLVYVADADSFDFLVQGQSVQDSFTYTVKDAAGASSTTTVAVTINGVADGAELVGGNKTQVLNGTALDEKISGGNADDTLYGNAGADRLYGNNGKDLLFGGQGSDRLFGENGADVLDGGIGNDTLTGGNGPDTFVFGAGFGRDVVTDWSGEDTMQFASSIFASSAQAFAAAAQVGADVVITAGAHEVLLMGVSLPSLTMSDFLIG